MNQATAQVSPLARNVGSRLYGVPMNWEQRAEQAFPQFCVSIFDEMVEASALLKLGEGADHEAIYAAYAIDLKFLKGRLADIVNMVDTAVRFSKAPRTTDNQLGEDAEWKAIRNSIPGFGSMNVLSMTADMAAQEPKKFLTDMKAAYHKGTEELLHRMCLWLDTLTAYEFVGQVELTSTTTGRYYYYRRSVTKQEIGKEEFVEPAEGSFDPFARQVFRKIDRTHYREDHDVELHEHDVVQVSRQKISDFEHPMPERVRNFLEQTAPWLLRHMGILSGMMISEKVIKRTARSEEVHADKVSEFVFDPAVTLGNYALVGWTEKDMIDGGVRSRIQKSYERARRSHLWRIAQVILAVLAVVVAAGFFVRHMINESDAKEVAKYQQFVSELNGYEQLTVKKNDYTVLLGTYPVAYMGKQQYGNGYRIALTNSVRDGWKEGHFGYYQMDSGPDRVNYGFADLGPALRIPLSIRVLNANDESVTFVVSRHYTLPQ